MLQLQGVVVCCLYKVSAVSQEGWQGSHSCRFTTAAVEETTGSGFLKAGPVFCVEKVWAALHLAHRVVLARFLEVCTSLHGL